MQTKLVPLLVREVAAHQLASYLEPIFDRPRQAMATCLEEGINNATDLLGWLFESVS